MWSSSIGTGEHVEIPIHFTPREIQEYAFQVPFLVNGVSTVHVKVEGKGVAARLELVQPQQADCSFGRVREGEDVTKHIQVVNRSARPLDFELLDEGGVLGAHDVSVNPRRVAGLKPKQVQSIEVRFAPQKRESGLRPSARVVLCRWSEAFSESVWKSYGHGRRSQYGYVSFWSSL